MSASVTNQDLIAVATQLGDRLLYKGLSLSTAESCTGGGIGHIVTSIPGSSDWFECGFITYSNTAKCRLLGVDGKAIQQHGAVSQIVVEQMASGAINHGHTNTSIAVTGIAGPGGGQQNKPVGTVWFGWSCNDQIFSECQHFKGDRESIRQQTILYALQKLLVMLKA